MVDDEDAAWPDHAGDVLQGQLLVTLVPYERHDTESDRIFSGPDDWQVKRFDEGGAIVPATHL